MKQNRLGSSGIMVSECCLGTMTFGQQNTEAEGHEQMSYALGRGVNFFDTAELYSIPRSSETQGKASECVGSWLASRSGDRSDVVIATKVCGYSETMPWIPKNRGMDMKQCRLDATSIRKAVEAELKRLQTPYIDLIQIHWPDRYVPSFGTYQFRPDRIRPDPVSFKEQIETMSALMREGKIRHYGLSNETTYGVCNFVQTADKYGLPKPVSIQNSYSLLHRTFDNELAEACYYYDIALLPWSPLGMGVLTGKYLDGTVPHGSRLEYFPDWNGTAGVSRWMNLRCVAATKEYATIAKENGLSPAALAIAWCKSRWHVASSIIGATKMTQLKENLDAFELELSPSVIEQCEKVHLNFREPHLAD